MVKTFTILMALSFIGMTVMAEDVGLNKISAPAVQIQFSRVCGGSNSYEEALAALSYKLNYPYIAIDVRVNYEAGTNVYKTYLKRPYKLHEKILYTKSGWGEYNELACVLVEGAPH